MNYTEEEASKLQCPMALGKGYPEPVFCLGSNCAWWRWAWWTDEDGNGQAFDDEGGECIPYKGRCGGCK